MSLAGTPPPPGMIESLSPGLPPLAGTPPPPGMLESISPELKEEKYGGVGSQIEAGLEGVARGATLGASDLAETKLFGVKPEDLAARQEVNPWTSGLGTLAGGAGLIAATGGLGAPAEALFGAGKLATGAALASEGAAFGAGSAVSDYAMGDPNLNAQKIATHIGLGSLLGLGLGSAGMGIKSILGKYGGVADSAAEAIDGAAGTTPPPVQPEPPGPVVDLPSEQTVPKSLSEIADLVKQAKAEGQTTELPQKAIALDAESRLGDLKYPLQKLQTDSLESQDARDTFKVAQELPRGLGRDFQDYEAIQKNERLAATDKAIQDLSPNAENTSNLVDGGERAVKTFSDNYAAKQAELIPALDSIKEYETKDPFNHIPGVIKAFTDKIPGISRMFDTSGDELKINPYSTAWDFKKPTYEAVKGAIEDLKDPAFIKELMGVRNGLSNHVNITDGSGASSEIAHLKSGMLDYIQKEIEKVDPFIKEAQDNIREGHPILDQGKADATHIRDTLKQWAVNEQQREVIEKVFGASVGTPEWSQISRVKPEEILPKIFRNTATVKAAKSFLNPEQFNEMLSNFLAAGREKSSTEGVFSSKKFGTFLEKNKYAIQEALSGHLPAEQRIRDLNTTMRLFPDSGTINPPRTAKTLAGILGSNELGEINYGTILGNAKGYFGEMVKDRALIKKVNEALGDTAVQQQKFAGARKIIKETDKKISDGIDSIVGVKK